MGVAIVMLFSLSTAMAAECEPRQPLVDQALSEFISANFSGVDLAVQRLSTAFGCGSVADPNLLARAWLIEGAWLYYEGHEHAATRAFRAANRADGSLWLPELGSEVRAAYDAAISGKAMTFETGTGGKHFPPPLKVALDLIVICCI